MLGPILKDEVNVIYWCYVTRYIASQQIILICDNAAYVTPPFKKS
jgi:hypothetical protein